MDAACSHLYGYLPRGELRDRIVICPVHKAWYGISTGNVVKNILTLMKVATGRQATVLRTYDVKADEDRILIRVPPDGDSGDG